ncbi:MAG: BatA domain-containing protein [candidate division KSB1 bacterium]|nr:BatA domain-containing protein [candidate division KSB1 bacterium]MDZ7272861.1 BatA domain-containing protein [candidate division KSB1 bacterium]MDZ7284116.1 BatA domain-containing protein [candidate division KSB1 bacterium]MDZ7297486.1 BatA domain-containing protein [candidate division KSB1 bacterium]MDZ7305622.1 BatA domain-containing protein [candidate division KSB1 bacterium]
MLSFLTLPYLWLGLAAAAIPVIIHLIHRNRAETVHFAAMRFLERTPAHLLRRQKLKQMLLLALRILALALLGLAFARPLLTGAQGQSMLVSEARSLALVIDISASMAAGHHLAEAVAAAGDVLRQARPRDQVSLIAAGAAVEVLAENVTPAEALAALARVQQRQSAGNLREAVQFADNLLQQAPGRQRQLHLFSDLQASNLPLGNLTLHSAAHLIPHAFEARWSNVALLAGERFDSDGRVVYACRVRNFAEQEQEIEVRLLPAGAGRRPLAVQRVILAPGAEQTIHFAAAGLALGETQEGARVFEISAALDEFAADNRFYVVPPAAPRNRVLLVVGEGGAERYLRSALELPGSDWKVTTSSPNTVAAMLTGDFTAMVLAGVTGMSPDAAQKLRAYVEQGGGLIIALGNRPPGETFNQLLAAVLPGRVLATVADARASVALTDIDFAHPVFSIFRDPANGDPSSIQVSRRYHIQPRAEAGRLAGFEDGLPALLELAVGRGRVLLWASTFDLSGGTLPVRGIFVPLLHQWLSYVRRAAAQNAVTLVGQPILIEGEFDAGSTITVTLPDGSRQEQSFATPAVFTETTAPGHYLFEQQGKRIWRAVNLDGRESDPLALPPEDLLARCNRPQEETQLSGVFGVAAPSARELERQQRLWRLALWAVLALLLCEGWLASRTPR